MTDWNDIVKCYGPVVWETAWRMLGNHDDALDCYQRCFMDAVKLVRREMVRNWSTTLRRLATARALDILRSRYRRARRHSTVNLTSVVSDQPGPPQSVETDELLARLRTELARLPERQAEVFCFVALEGMTYSEVADRLNVSTSAVGMLLRRARVRLRQRLDLVEPKKCKD